MSYTLPPVSTSHLVELASPYAPDDPCRDMSALFYWRAAAGLGCGAIMAVLTFTNSLNLLVRQLPEQAAWRRFARLLASPDVSPKTKPASRPSTPNSPPSP